MVNYTKSVFISFTGKRSKYSNQHKEICKYGFPYENVRAFT